MANDFSLVMPKILARGLMALRTNSVMARLVNTSYSAEAAAFGAVINVPLPASATGYDVSPTVTLVANQDYTPTVAQVTLDFWKASRFHMTDKEVKETGYEYATMQESAALEWLAKTVDQYIMGKHVGFYGAAGAAGTVPFNGSLTAAASARRLLNKQLAPVEGRFAVIDPDAETNLLLNTNILQADQSGSDDAIVKGSIGRKLGFDWSMDQNVTSYTPGTGWVTGWALSTVGGAVGDTTLNILNATASGTIKIGDIFTVAGRAQQHVVTANATASATVARLISFYPALLTAAATADAITVIGTAYVAHLAFHPNAIVWASRPLGDVEVPGNLVQSMSDPQTGITLRLEISRQNKQTSFEYDILGGANVVRREFGVKILG